MAMSSEVTAWDDAATRVAWTRYRRNAWLLAAVGVVLLIASTTMLDITRRPLEELERSGDRVPGAVTERNPGARTAGSVRFDFAYRGESRNGKVNLDLFSPRYDPGDPVIVLVDPEDPTSYTLAAFTAWGRWRWARRIR